MKTSTKIIAVIVIFVSIIGGYSISTYNSLTTAKVQVDTQFAKIDTEMQRRQDMYQPIVDIIEKAVGHENEAIKAVADARAKMSGATTINDKIDANNQYNTALGRLLVVQENYPNLKANDQLRDFQVQVEGTENRLSVARKDYNAVVATYNTKVQRFPGNLVAKTFGFDSVKLFEADQSAKQVPKLNFK